MAGGGKMKKKVVTGKTGEESKEKEGKTWTRIKIDKKE